MNLLLRPLEREEALACAPEVDRMAAETMAEFRDEDLPTGVGTRLIERALDAREGLVLVAESDAGRQALAITVPFEDPLSGERVPLLVLLHVDPDLRHRGVARAMVEELRARLADRGIHTLAARAAHNDDALISMGERWGFTRSWELMLHE